MKAKPFNLLKPMSPPLTVWDKIYTWVTTQARIVIFVVIILITVAFVGKVVVDTEAKNKKKELDNLLQQLSFYGAASEPDVRRIIRRADVYSEINSKHTSFAFLIDEVYQILGNSSSELTIRMEEDRVTIYGSEDISLLKELEIGLRTSSYFTNIVFDSISIESDEQVQNSSFGQYAVTAIINKEKTEWNRIK